MRGCLIVVKISTKFCQLKYLRIRTTPTPSFCLLCFVQAEQILNKEKLTKTKCLDSPRISKTPTRAEGILNTRYKHVIQFDYLHFCKYFSKHAPNHYVELPQKCFYCRSQINHGLHVRVDIAQYFLTKYTRHLSRAGR